MKRTIIFVFGAVVLNATALNAQEQKENRTEIQKEVRMEEENGEKTLTIRTKQRGSETVEVYKGEEAEKKLKELQSEQEIREVKEEVRVNEENGEKIVRIDRTVNGVTTSEEFKGEEADKKLRELEGENAPKKSKGAEIKRQEIKRIEVKRN